MTETSPHGPALRNLYRAIDDLLKWWVCPSRIANLERAQRYCHAAERQIEKLKRLFEEGEEARKLPPCAIHPLARRSKD